jgi:hypothetical protein
MMDSGGMVRDLAWGLYFIVTVMYIMGHGGMTLFIERYGSMLQLLSSCTSQL